MKKGNWFTVKCPKCGRIKYIPEWYLKRLKYVGYCIGCVGKEAIPWPTGERHYCWKGGRKKDVKGYIHVKLYPDNFFYPMVNASHYVLEHRLIMAQYLQRCLLSWEVVHHKNGIKDDNKLGNLELLSTRHLVDQQTKALVKRLQGRVLKLEQLLKVNNITV